MSVCDILSILQFQGFANLKRRTAIFLATDTYNITNLTTNLKRRTAISHCQNRAD